MHPILPMVAVKWRYVKTEGFIYIRETIQPIAGQIFQLIPNAARIDMSSDGNSDFKCFYGRDLQYFCCSWHASGVLLHFRAEALLVH